MSESLCQRINVAGRTATKAPRQLKHRDKSANAVRVAKSIRRGLTSRSIYSKLVPPSRPAQLQASVAGVSPAGVQSASPSSICSSRNTGDPSASASRAALRPRCGRPYRRGGLACQRRGQLRCTRSESGAGWRSVVSGRQMEGVHPRSGIPRGIDMPGRKAVTRQAAPPRRRTRPKPR